MRFGDIESCPPSFSLLRYIYELGTGLKSSILLTENQPTECRFMHVSCSASVETRIPDPQGQHV